MPNTLRNPHSNEINRLVQRYPLWFLEATHILIRGALNEDDRAWLIWFETAIGTKPAMILYLIFFGGRLILAGMFIGLIILAGSILIVSVAAIFLFVVLHISVVEVLICDIKATESFCLIENYTSSNCSERRDSIYQIMFDVFDRVIHKHDYYPPFHTLGADFENDVKELVKRGLNKTSEDLLLIIKILKPIDTIFNLISLPMLISEEIELQCKNK